MTSTDLERCKKNLRSILLASKGGLRLSQVSSEYSNLYEEDIPFRNLNYQSLEMFLLSIPDVCTLREGSGEAVVEGVGNQATKHIKNLVQQTAKNKKGGGGGLRESRRPCQGRASPRKQPSQAPSQGPGFKLKQKQSQPPPAFIGPIKPKTVQVTNLPFSVWRDQLVQILRVVPGGATEQDVEGLYQAKYRAALPKIWSKVLVKAGLIDVDTENSHNSKPLIYLTSQCQAEPTIPTIRRPVGPLWDVIVMAVDCRRKEAWLTLQDPNSHEIRNQLQVHLFLQHHSGQSYRGEAVLPGQYFSAEVLKGVYRRAQIIQVDRGDLTCRCFLIDYGTEMDVSWKSLVRLHPTCRTTPAQALRVRLSGFNHSINSEFTGRMMVKLEGKRFTLREVKGSSCDIPELRIFYHDKKSEVQFLDQLMKDLKLDEECQEKEAGGLSPGLKAQELPGEGDIHDYNVSHVVSPGEVWVQPCLTAQKYVCMKKELSLFYNRETGRHVSHPEPGMTVAVRVGRDWFRARVVLQGGSIPNIKGGKGILVRLVDSGKLQRVKINCLRSLEASFAVLPVQALKVQLEGIDRCDEVTNYLLGQLCLQRSLVGHVSRREGETVYLILYDSSQGLNANINAVLEENAKKTRDM